MSFVGLLGVSALVGGTLVLCFWYKNYLKQVGNILSEYLLFLKHIRLRIAVYGEPYSVAFRGFCGDELCKNGFLSYLVSGENPDEAFNEAEKRGVLTEEGRALIKDAFSGLGRSGLQDEIKRIDGYISLLEEYLKRYLSDCEKKTKSLFAMALAAVMGISILTI